MESLDIMQLLTGVNLVVMIAIGVIAFALESSKRVGDGAATLIPLVLGGLWGVVDGYGQAAAGQDPVVVCIVKGALVNGGGASLAARLVKSALERLPGGTGPGRP